MAWLDSGEPISSDRPAPVLDLERRLNADWYVLSKYTGDFDYVAGDWTHISDVGKVFHGEVLTMARYLQVEDAYVSAVQRLLSSAGVVSLRVHGLERHGDDSQNALDEFSLRQIHEAAMVSLAQVCGIVRMCLRSELWCGLSSREGCVRFGQDLYVFVGPASRCPDLVSEEADLYIEAAANPDSFR